MKTIEPLKNLSSLLAQHEEASAALDKHLKLLEQVQKEVDAFVASGDLSDDASVAAIVTRRTQQELLPLRVSSLEGAAGLVEDQIVEENTALLAIATRAFETLTRGLTEQFAQRNRESYARIEEARRHGLKTKPVEELHGRRRMLEMQVGNSDAFEGAKLILKELPEVLEQLERVERDLGGASTIPDAATIYAI